METVSENLYTVHNIEEKLRRLSPEKLRIVMDFLTSLEERESTEATDELLSIPNFETDFQEALEQVKRGDVVPFKSIRRHV